MLLVLSLAQLLQKAPDPESRERVQGSGIQGLGFRVQG